MPDESFAEWDEHICKLPLNKLFSKVVGVARITILEKLKLPYVSESRSL